MSDFNEQWETRLQAAAQQLPYPHTPDITRAVRIRLVKSSSRPAPGRLADRRWRAAMSAAAILLVLLAGLLAVPTVRAAVLQFLQIGAIRILLPAATSALTAALLPTQPAAGRPAQQALGASLPSQPPPPTSLPAELVNLAGLQGETTLAEAILLASFPLQLPSYPGNLGPPDRVYLQDLGGDLLVLVW